MKKGAIIILLLFTLFLFVARPYHQASNLNFLAVAATFLVLVSLYIFFAAEEFRGRLNAFVGTGRGKAFLFAGLVFILYALYVTATGPFRGIVLAKTAAYMVLPLLILSTLKEPKQRLTGQDFLVIIAIWFPVEFGWINLGRGGNIGGADHIITKLLAIDVALFIFLIMRKLQGVGYIFSLKRKDIPVIALCYLAFAVIAIPVGLAIRFIHFTPRLPQLETVIVKGLGIFFTIALAEELLFRGIIHNLIQKSLPGKYGLPLALAISSLIFGAAHLNNLGGGNTRYFLLSAIAGVFYGLAYIRTGKVVASALVHTLVNLTWALFFQ